MDSKKGRIGFTAGNFDLLHPGYIYTFEAAKENCDYFIVFLQRDPSLTRFTKYKPVVPLYERYRTLMSIKYIDEVVCYDDEEDLLRMMPSNKCSGVTNSSPKDFKMAPARNTTLFISRPTDCAASPEVFGSFCICKTRLACRLGTLTVFFFRRYSTGESS